MEKAVTLPALLKTSAIKSRFTEILGDNASSFISSILTICKDNDKLRKCEPKSILTSAAKAANLKLPIEPQLGYAYIIPYYDYKTQTYSANFQIGYKGMIQLAMRTGLYQNINTTEIYEGQIKSFDFITGAMEVGERTSDVVVGYAAFFKLLNGFSKTLYMSKADIEKHAMTFSETYKNEKTRQYSTWTKNFNEMAKKTVLKKLLTTYAPISIEFQNNVLARAMQEEQPPTTIEPSDDDFVLEPIDPQTGEFLSNAETVENAEEK